MILRKIENVKPEQRYNSEQEADLLPSDQVSPMQCYLPLVLDACCGGRQFWFDKENENVLFVDRRVMQPKVVGSGKDARVRKCLPDKVMDFRNLDLPDNTFRLVVFDPPHLFLGENSFMAQSYGTLDKQTWKEDISKGFAECFRVLKNEGILIFKWNECDVPLKDILKLTEQKTIVRSSLWQSSKNTLGLLHEVVCQWQVTLGPLCAGLDKNERQPERLTVNEQKL